MKNSERITEDLKSFGAAEIVDIQPDDPSVGIPMGWVMFIADGKLFEMSYQDALYCDSAEKMASWSKEVDEEDF